MVEERITDGRRIAELLSSELHGRSDGALGPIEVVEADPDVEPSPNGALAYRLTLAGDPFGGVYVHPDRARIELRSGLEAAVEVATEAGLRVRPKAVEPPRVLIFVESGAAVKRAVDAVDAAAADATAAD